MNSTLGVGPCQKSQLRPSGTAEAWNDGLLRVELYDSTATVWLSTYGVAPAAVVELEREWRTVLPRLLI